MMTTLTMTTRSERVVDGDDDELVAARDLPAPLHSSPSQPIQADEDKVPMGKTKRPAALCYNVPMKILFNATRLDETRLELSSRASP